jgi:hypothetical protein
VNSPNPTRPGNTQGMAFQWTPRDCRVKVLKAGSVQYTNATASAIARAVSNRDSARNCLKTSFHRTQHLADAHFLCAFGGACGGEVHEINTSDQEHEDGYDAENIYILNVSVCFQFPVKVGMQVDIRQWLEEEADVVTFFPEVLEGNAHCLWQLGADIFVYFLRQFCL